MPRATAPRSVLLTAQVVDKYGTPVTDTAVVGNKKIVF